MYEYLQLEMTLKQVHGGRYHSCEYVAFPNQTNKRYRLQSQNYRNNLVCRMWRAFVIENTMI